MRMGVELALLLALPIYAVSQRKRFAASLAAKVKRARPTWREPMHYRRRLEVALVAFMALWAIVVVLRAVR